MPVPIPCPQEGEQAAAVPSSARERSCSVPANATASTQRALQGQHLPPGHGKTPEFHLSCQNSPKAGNWGLELPCFCYFLPFSLGLLQEFRMDPRHMWDSHLFSFRQYSPSVELSWAMNWHKTLSITGSIWSFFQDIVHDQQKGKGSVTWSRRDWPLSSAKGPTVIIVLFYSRSLLKQFSRAES